MAHCNHKITNICLWPTITMATAGNPAGEKRDGRKEDGGRETMEGPKKERTVEKRRGRQRQTEWEKLLTCRAVPLKTGFGPDVRVFCV